jgi:putative effector of murein hydrolase LrgA (UPF0299 family)
MKIMVLVYFLVSIFVTIGCIYALIKAKGTFKMYHLVLLFIPFLCINLQYKHIQSWGAFNINHKLLLATLIVAIINTGISMLFYFSSNLNHENEFVYGIDKLLKKVNTTIKPK